MTPANLVLIDKDGTEKHRCEWCLKMRADVYYVNPGSRKSKRRYLCEGCHGEIMATIRAECVRQQVAGVPEGEREVPIPLGVVFSNRMCREVRAMLEEIEATEGRKPMSHARSIAQ